MINVKIRDVYKKNYHLINDILGTFIVKGASLFINLFTLPAYMNYFSNQFVLGLWFTIVSVLNWILLFDLGVGSGLRNKLVPALVNNDNLLIKKYISSAYIIMSVLTLFVMLTGSIFISLVNWNAVLNIPLEVVSSDVLTMVLILIFIGIILQFFLRLITSILFAMQKVAVSNFISLSSSVLILLYVTYFNTGNIEDNLMNLAIVNILSVNFPLLVTTIVIFFTKLKESKPNIKYYENEVAYSLLKLSGNFFWIQLTLLFMNSTNEMLITWFYGSEYVVEYKIYYSLFYLLVTLFSLIANPIWSAISEAYSKKQFNWIISLNKKIKVLVLLVTVCNVILMLFSQSIVDIWLRDESIKINYGYASIFVLFSTITMYNMSSSVFANGIGVLRCQAICYSIAAIVKLPLVIILSYYVKDWICIIMVHSLINLPYSIIQPKLLQMLYKRLLTKRLVENT